MYTKEQTDRLKVRLETIENKIEALLATRDKILIKINSEGRKIKKRQEKYNGKLSTMSCIEFKEDFIDEDNGNIHSIERIVPIAVDGKPLRPYNSYGAIPGNIDVYKRKQHNTNDIRATYDI